MDKKAIDDIGSTIKFKKPNGTMSAHEVLMSVYASMREKGYDPVSQIVGYLISGDPTYITSFNNARYLIRTLERYELMEELVSTYIDRYDNGDII